MLCLQTASSFDTPCIFAEIYYLLYVDSLTEKRPTFASCNRIFLWHFSACNRFIWNHQVMRLYLASFTMLWNTCSWRILIYWLESIFGHKVVTMPCLNADSNEFWLNNTHLETSSSKHRMCFVVLLESDLLEYFPGISLDLFVDLKENILWSLGDLLVPGYVDLRYLCVHGSAGRFDEERFLVLVLYVRILT